MLDITDLPRDVFYQICSYLKTSDILAFSAAIDKFDIGKSYWKNRINQLWKGIYPCLPDSEVDWLSVNLFRDKYALLLGTENSSRFQYFTQYAVNHGIDAIHIPPKYPDYLLVGDRGRCLSLFSFKDLSNGKWVPFYTQARSHTGWIWTIGSCGDTVITGSWDGMLRAYFMTPMGLPFEAAYRLGSAILCSSFLDPNTVAVGTQSRNVYIVDLRIAPDKNIPVRLRHNNAVLCMDSVFKPEPTATNSNESTTNMFKLMAAGDHFLTESHSELSSIAASDEDLFGLGDMVTFEWDHTDKDKTTCIASDNVYLEDMGQSISSQVSLFTGSSDQYLAGWDLRNVSNPVLKHKLLHYPRQISLLEKGELWVAEPPNRVHVFDARGNQLQCVHTNDIPGWKRGFGGMKATFGCIVACSLDGTVEAFHPTYPLYPISDKPLAENIASSPTSLEFYDDILVVGSGNGSIYVWTSKQKHDSWLQSSDHC